jgi:hypothetical protein
MMKRGRENGARQSHVENVGNLDTTSPLAWEGQLRSKGYKNSLMKHQHPRCPHRRERAKSTVDYCYVIVVAFGTNFCMQII